MSRGRRPEPCPADCSLSPLRGLRRTARGGTFPRRSPSSCPPCDHCGGPVRCVPTWCCCPVRLCTTRCHAAHRCSLAVSPPMPGAAPIAGWRPRPASPLPAYLSTGGVTAGSPPWSSATQGHLPHGGGQPRGGVQSAACWPRPQDTCLPSGGSGQRPGTLDGPREEEDRLPTCGECLRRGCIPRVLDPSDPEARCLACKFEGNLASLLWVSSPPARGLALLRPLASWASSRRRWTPRGWRSPDLRRMRAQWPTPPGSLLVRVELVGLLR